MNFKGAVNVVIWVVLGAIGVVLVVGVIKNQDTRRATLDAEGSHEREPAPAPQAPAAPTVVAPPTIDAAARDVLAVDAGIDAAPPIAVSARQLYADYDANEVNADAKYRGKAIEVTGIVTKIGKDALDKPFVALATRDEFNSVLASFDSEEAVVSLKKGYKLIARCRGVGMTLGSPGLDQCVVEHVFQWVPSGNAPER